MRLKGSLLVPFRIAPLVLVLAAPAIAQNATPPPAATGSSAARTPLPVSRSLSLDLAAARDHTLRFLLEPLVFGRVSVGISGSYTDQTDVPWYGYPMPADPIPGAPCPPNCWGPPDDQDYQAWTLDLNVRWYPGALSVNTAQAKAMLYIGEFVGFTQRSANGYPWIYCPVCDRPVPPDSTVVGPSGPNVADQDRMSFIGGRQTWEAIEPGFEAGVRVQASRHFFFDVGGRWRLVRVDDPYSAQRPGQVDPRLVVAAGLSW
jgi:hypothetical protein